MDLGDRVEDSTIDFTFTTRDDTGLPTTLSGSPALSVYKANGTTESTAGITLSVDFDSRAGLNQVRIDTSADAFYATANDYMVVITAGTVDSVSVVGETVATFSIENRYMRGTNDALQPTTLGRTLDVTVNGTAGIDWGNVENPATTVDLSDTSINLCDTVTVNTDMRGTDNALLASSAPTNWSSLDIDVSGRVEIQGTKNTLDDLNDIAATDIVTAGAITTLSGAVVNVDLVDVCTTNSDMRGTDNALLASSAPANWSSMLITAGGELTVGTNNDKSGYSISGTITTLDGLNNFDPISDQVIVATNNDKSGYSLSSSGIDAIFTSQMTESYAADGVEPTMAQCLYITMQNLQDFQYAGTTETVRQINGSSTAATYTLDDATNPTSKTRTT